MTKHPPGRNPRPAPTLAARTMATLRHTTRYLEAGPSDGPLMIFLHGWPEMGLVWRVQMEVFAAEGWRCIAPDMRGYGGSSAPAASEAYALSEIVQDMVELHNHLGARRPSGSATTWAAPSPGPWPRTIRSSAGASCWCPFPTSQTASP
jgi:pimeloyl-ACP methyl ester carboxylesterase